MRKVCFSIHENHEIAPWNVNVYSFYEIMTLMEIITEMSETCTCEKPVVQ